jgi:hypothetical protein
MLKDEVRTLRKLTGLNLLFFIYLVKLYIISSVRLLRK